MIRTANMEWHSPLLHLVEGLQLRNGHKDDNRLLATTDIDFTRRGDLEGSEFGLEVTDRVLEVNERLSDAQLNLIGLATGCVCRAEDFVLYGGHDCDMCGVGAGPSYLQTDRGHPRSSKDRTAIQRLDIGFSLSNMVFGSITCIPSMPRRMNVNRHTEASLHGRLREDRRVWWVERHNYNQDGGVKLWTLLASSLCQTITNIGTAYKSTHVSLYFNNKTQNLNTL
jgi:hypothetical protein